MHTNDPHLFEKVAKLGAMGYAAKNMAKGEAPENLAGQGIQLAGNFFIQQELFKWVILPLIGITAAICFFPDILMFMTAHRPHYHWGGKPVGLSLGHQSTGWWMLFWVFFTASLSVWVWYPGRIIFCLIVASMQMGNQSLAGRPMITEHEAIVIYLHSQMYVHAMTGTPPAEFMDGLLCRPTREQWEKCYPSHEWRRNAQKTGKLVPQRLEWSKRYPTQEAWDTSDAFPWIIDSWRTYGSPYARDPYRTAQEQAVQDRINEERAGATARALLGTPQ